MQKRLLILLCMLLITTILVMGMGAYLKYGFLAPVGLLRDKSLIEIPFAAMKDPAVRFVLENSREKETEPTQLPTESATEPTQLPTEPVTEPTQLPTESVPEPTEIPTEAPFIEVTEDWFDDVLFIGDSRTVGLRDYARLGNADYFCSIGMTVFDATKVALSDQNFETMKLETLLQSKRYSKIYISLGLNECGYPYDLLMDGYESLVQTVRNLQPNAVILLQALVTVSRQKAASEWYFSLENLAKVNQGIYELTDGNMIRFIDANDYFADEEGYLPSELTADGCHFYMSGYRDWAQWIYENAKKLSISFG